MNIEQAEAVSALLTAGGAGHELLAARNYEREAEVIAAAGRPGAITIVVTRRERGRSGGGRIRRRWHATVLCSLARSWEPYLDL